MHMGHTKEDYICLGQETARVAWAEIEKCKKLDNQNTAQRITLFLTIKIVTTFSAIMELGQASYYNDSKILARSLLEAYAKSEFINLSETPEKTGQDFLDFTKKKTAKVFRRVDKYPAGTQIRDTMLALDPSGNRRNIDIKLRYWNENITKIFQSIATQQSAENDIARHAHEWYDILSDLVHSNAKAMNLYVDTGEDANNNEKLFFRDIHILCVILMMSVEILCKTFQYKLSEEIVNAVKSKLTELQPAQL